MIIEPASLDIVTRDGVDGFTYTLMPGEHPEDDPVAEIDVDALGARLNGTDLDGDTEVNTTILQVSWTEDGVSKSGTFLLMETEPAEHPLWGSSADMSVFVLDGDHPPQFGTLAEWDAWIESVTVAEPTGDVAPGQFITFDDAGGTTFRAHLGTDGDDNLTGSGKRNFLDGGDGNDTLNGSNGRDRLFGGDGDDSLTGGAGNDWLDPGDNSFWDQVRAGTGRDTISLSSIEEGFVDIYHDDLDQGIVARIDGDANTAVIDKGSNGRTEIIDIAKPMYAGWNTNTGGLGLWGTDHDDRFFVNALDDGWMNLVGGAGNDVFFLEDSNDHIRLSYNLGATTGIRANLEKGVVYNDGQGGRDRIEGDVFEFRASDLDDRIIGSSGNDRFIT
ncbi:calcium-binding protein [Leisingera sp. ANG-Vp]|uniref:calcium-binding protein n=1 Tax=Leisingera sp. ANG-Vp TaxID=1577896 RepID=UPI00057F3204|nr:hypothetical protein [Leisingera sp. ANG-Vp]KIC17562.1 hypothetical protein RA20_14445 [Leisingera sp. ANG-Vp]